MHDTVSAMNDNDTTQNTQGNWSPDPIIENYMQSLSATELRWLASYARKMAAGMEDPSRKPGAEGGSYLSAQYTSNGSGPYFYLKTYHPGDHTYTLHTGEMKSGKTKTRYVGKRLPADLAEKFGYPEGATPEQTDLNITGTPGSNQRGKRKKAE